MASQKKGAKTKKPASVKKAASARAKPAPKPAAKKKPAPAQKKAPVAKAAPPKPQPAPVEIDNGLTANQMKELRRVLEQKRDELRRSINHRRDRDSAIDPSEIIEELEQASAGQQQDVQLRILDKEVKLLREIERALKKFDGGEYGLCEATGEPIGYARLNARPWARYSVTHKEELERAQREQSVLRPSR